jgi:haloalkane dehalogenase
MNSKTDKKIRNFFPFVSNFAEIDGFKYHFIDVGDKNSQNILLLLHGNPTWSFYFKDLILALKDEGYRIIAPDHIGCGFSDKPQDYDYTLERHIANLELLIDHLGLKPDGERVPRITLGLHDWGGAIGMGFAVNNPRLIDKFIIFNTAAFLIKRLPKRIAMFRLPVIGTVGIRALNLFAYPAIYMACKRKDKMTSELKEGLLYPYQNFHDRIANLEFVRDIPLTERDRSYRVVEKIQNKLHLFKETPMLILWGKKDFCFNDIFLDKWREYFPDADVHLFKDVGHYVVIDARDEIPPIIKDFLIK